MSTGWSSLHPTEVIAFYTKHKTVIDKVLLWMPKEVKGITSAAVLGTIARAAYHLDNEKLRHFISDLCNGGVGGPTHLLRDNLLQNRYAGGAKARAIVYAKTARAILAYVSGQQLNQLREVPKDPFPLPKL